MTTAEQATAPAGGPAPGWPPDWDRVLDRAIRTWGGRWDTSRVQQLYAVRYGRRLYRDDARAFLSRRARQGVMQLHDRPNSRYYTLRKDVRP
ncbi:MULTISPECIES: hypothetical protein [unclassified Streptomyces]|uniref:hypothetical protein n=1 Tax=unclassified Streptomyces TaxID=2593676 RepID=UPI002E2C1261|nr:hypothetical protein [Streptomyces sp. NBC_00228]